MLQRLDQRCGHYLLLLFVWAIVTLPDLGGPSLWDVDEGANSRCSYEMEESGNRVVPNFNGDLRVDKPALINWLQGAAFEVFGPDEFAARLPSALASFLAVLAVYELGRRTFGRHAGLLAGMMLAAAAAFCAASRFANPDALLDLFTLSTMLVFWRAYRRPDRRWHAVAGVTCGLAMLAKGPVGLVLPSAVAVLFLAWERRLRFLCDPRFLWGVLTFLLVAGPWYTWVALETKGEWTHGFFGKHNFERFQHPLENHGGPVFYYLLVLLVGFAPWSVFLGPALRDAWTQLRPKPRSALRFLACWAFVYLGVFTVAGTKLPNYVLPIYPALALLTARFLDRWRRGEAHPAAWELPTSLGFLALVGVAAAVGLLTVGGVFGADVLRGRILPGVERLAWLGLLPVAGAVLGWGSLRQDRRTGLIAAAVLTGVLFTAGLAAFGESAVDRYKAAKPLAEALPTDQTRRDVRIGTFDYFQPSLVFYCRRKVQTFSQEQDALDLLRGPMPSFLFVPSARWDAMKDRLDVPYRLLARHYDLYAGKDVVVVTNR